MVPEINLLPKMERKKSNNLYVILSLILVGVLLSIMTLQLVSYKRDIGDLTETEAQFVAERDALHTEVAAASTVDQDSLATSVTFVENVSYPVSPLIEEVHSLLLENSYLRDYQFSETDVNLTVDVETMGELSFFLERLLDSTYFVDVKVEQISNFEPFATVDETKENYFDIQPRYSATINLTIDQAYLRAGGSVNE